MLDVKIKVDSLDLKDFPSGGFGHLRSVDSNISSIPGLRKKPTGTGQPDIFHDFQDSAGEMIQGEILFSSQGFFFSKELLQHPPPFFFFELANWTELRSNCAL